MVQEKRWIAHFFMVFSQLNFGVYNLVTKFALTSGINQIVFCVLRDTVALCILLPFAFFTDWRSRPGVSPRLLLHFLVLGLSGVFLTQLLYLLGLDLTSPAYGSAFLPSVPVFTFVLALINGTETLEWKTYHGLAKIGGVFFSVFGALLMSIYKGPLLFGREGVNAGFDKVLQNNNSMDTASWRLGTLCFVGSCFFMAAYIAYQAPLLAEYPHAITVTAYSYVFGTILLVFTAWVSVRRSDWVITHNDLFAVLFAGVVASAVNYLLYSWSNSVLGPSMVALYMPLQPFVSPALACIFLDSPLYLGSVLGSLFITAGLFLVTWGKTEAERRIRESLLN